MAEQEKWDFIISIDEELLFGGAMLSEWTTFLAKYAETAFCSGANLSSILACQAAIESHLRYDYFYDENTRYWSFYDLIEKAELPSELKEELHDLRRYRNKWVHVKDPNDDNQLLEKPDYYEAELSYFAKKTIKVMLKVLYSNQFV